MNKKMIIRVKTCVLTNIQLKDTLANLYANNSVTQKGIIWKSQILILFINLKASFQKMFCFKIRHLFVVF